MRLYRLSSGGESAYVPEVMDGYIPPRLPERDHKYVRQIVVLVWEAGRQCSTVTRFTTDSDTGRAVMKRLYRRGFLCKCSEHTYRVTGIFITYIEEYMPELFGPVLRVVE